MGATYKVDGIKETMAAFDELADELGDRKANSKFLISALKTAMIPVLISAKARVPRDTGLLASTLHIEARRPTNKDKKSIYISAKDQVIALMGTKAIPKSLKNKFAETHAGLISDYQSSTKGSEFKKIALQKLKAAKKSFYAQNGIAYDARAIAMEFGTGNVSAHPFMRVSLESNARTISENLAKLINEKIQNYRSKTK